jgi:hypothetical protein
MISLLLGLYAKVIDKNEDIDNLGWTLTIITEMWFWLIIYVMLINS